MKKILFLFTLVIACVVFTAEKSIAAGFNGGNGSRNLTFINKNKSPERVITTTIYQQCTDGSFEPIETITTFTNTVGSQTVTTSVIATRQASIGCLSYTA